MSNLGAVTKVADQLVKRIFDQRQFTSGEINYLVKELGSESNFEANFDKILKINENVCLIGDEYSGDLCKPYEKLAVDACEQVTKLLERTDTILKSESIRRLTSDKVINEERKRSEVRKEQCLMECKIRLASLQESSLEEELDLERKYIKFEEGLSKNDRTTIQ